MRASACSALEALPGDALALLEAAPFLNGAAWWRCVSAAACPPGARPHLLVLGDAGGARCVVPLLREAGGGLRGFDTPYTITWQPIAAAGVAAADLIAFGRALGRACGAAPVLRLDALDPDWPGLAPFLEGLRRGGRVLLRFDHFGNWRQDVAGQTWDAYLAGRPGALRETIRRKQARAARDPALTLTLATTVADLATALPDYAGVYGRSWKQAEPYPAFDSCLLHAAAAAGVLRLGVFRQGGTPIAAQYWIVQGGTATVLKLAHDEQYRPLSPGTVLTAWMIRRMIEVERVAVLDFGRGDDPYKQDWVGRRRQFTGVLAASPLHWRGMAAIGRQALGRAARALRRR